MALIRRPLGQTRSLRAIRKHDRCLTRSAINFRQAVYRHASTTDRLGAHRVDDMVAIWFGLLRTELIQVAMRAMTSVSEPVPIGWPDGRIFGRFAFATIKEQI